MRRLTRLVVVALCVWVSRTVHAQEVLTLDQAVADAHEHSPALARSRAAVEESDANRREARAAWFPRISFSESWQRSDQPVFAFGALLAARRFTAADFAVDRLNRPGPANLFTSRIAVQQTLFDGSQSRAAVDAARDRRDAARASLDAAAADLAVAITRAYGRALAADAAVRAAATAVESAAEDVRRAERQRAAGRATDADVLAMSVRQADMQQRRIQADGDAAVARAELNRLMGAPIERTYQLREPVLPTAVPAGLSTLFAEADRARPELRQAAAQRAAAEADVARARAGWYPTVTVEAGYQADGLRVADRAGSWMVGGELQWSLSTGGATAARVSAAEAGLAAARAVEDDARAAVHVDVFTALKRLEAARARLSAGESAVEQARESGRIIRNRYDAGLAEAGDVLRAGTAEFDAESQRTAALVDAITAHAELERALGGAHR